MSLISFTPVVDGATATAASVNTPFSTMYNDYNGNITDANISASAAIAGTKIGTGLTVSNFATGTTELGYVSGSPSAVIPNAYTTYATVTIASTGGKVRCTGVAQILDSGSGAARSGHIRVQLDGATMTDSDMVWNTFSSGAYAPVLMTMPESTPAAGSHTWTFQVEADTASASLLKSYQFSVVEVK